MNNADRMVFGRHPMPSGSAVESAAYAPSRTGQTGRCNRYRAVDAAAIAWWCPAGRSGVSAAITGWPTIQEGRGRPSAASAVAAVSVVRIGVSNAP